jgi:hypothetical protein
MTTFRFLLPPVFLFALAACTADIATDPNTFSLEPGRVSHLRRPQSVSLANGFEAESKRSFKINANTWVFDEKQLTNTAIAVLNRGMTQQGLAVEPNGGKTIVMRASVLGARVRTYPFVAFVDARVGLHADFGDGTKTYVEADNSSPAGAPRAYDGAMLFALQQLLTDEKFVAYINR